MPAPSKFGPPKHWREYHTHLELLQRHHSFKEWETAQRSGVHDSAVDDFAQLLTLVLIFLAEGNRRKKTLGPRVWVLLYAIRPDLIEGESMKFASKAFGYRSEMSLVVLLNQLREALPALSLDTNSRRGHASPAERAARSENCRQACFRNWEARKAMYRDKISA